MNPPLLSVRLKLLDPIEGKSLLNLYAFKKSDLALLVIESMNKGIGYPDSKVLALPFKPDDLTFGVYDPPEISSPVFVECEDPFESFSEWLLSQGFFKIRQQFDKAVKKHFRWNNSTKT